MILWPVVTYRRSNGLRGHFWMAPPATTEIGERMICHAIGEARRAQGADIEIEFRNDDGIPVQPPLKVPA